MKTLIEMSRSLFDGKLRHLSRFSLVGVFNTLVDFSTFTILNSLIGVNYALSQAIGYSVGVANSFIFNKNWTFKDTGSEKNKLHELLQFIMVNLVTLAITTVLISILVGKLKMNVYIAKIVVTFAAQVINFLAYKLWVFKRGSVSWKKE